MKTSDSIVEKKRLYWVWADMRSRCTNMNHKQYPNYGGRGIAVCDRWNTFAMFFEDMFPRQAGLTLDRIDNNKGYSKDNCRWATRQQNNLNKRIYKTNGTGVRGLEERKDQTGKFRVRVRRDRKIIIDVTLGDFFEACCIAKKYELIDRE